MDQWKFLSAKNMKYSNDYYKQNLAKKAQIRDFQASQYSKICKYYIELKEKDVKCCKSVVNKLVNALSNAT
jgi:hypothetical protein